MSIADKLNYLIETKIAIKNALIEKGVELSENDTFRSYATKISETSGGGTKIYVKNSSGNDINKGDKVLVNLGLHPSESPTNKSLTSTTSYPRDYGNVFTDNENAFVWFMGKKRKYTFTDGKWTSTDIESWINPYCAGFILHKNGTVNMNAVEGYTSNGALLYSSISIATTDQTRYLGSYNGKDYAIKTNGNIIYNYDLSTNTVDTSTSLLNMADNTTVAYLDDDTGVGFSISTNKLVDFFYVNDEGTFNYFGAETVTLPDSYTFLANFTGSGIGDYLLFSSQWTQKYGGQNSGATSSKKSTLVIYRIIENETGGRTLEPVTDILKQFQEEDCLVQFDLRNDVLSIGTRKNVYAYKFNREIMDFEQLPYEFNLTENTSNTFCYRLSFSPDLSKAVVTLRSDVKNMSVTLYTLGKDEWEIVNNQVFNYNSTTSYTGFATGNIDEEGKVEVEMLLPKGVM